MDIYIKWDNDEHSLQIPVNPESVSESESMNNTSEYIHNKGEINLKGKRSLKSASWTSFFPAQDYEFCRCTPKEPYDYYCKRLENLMERNETIHLIITETDINFYGTIESFEHGPGDRSMDVSYTISIKEHREVNRKTRPKKKAKETTKKWTKGTTWHSLAKKYLGDSSKYKMLRSLNASVIHKAKKKHPKAREKDALIGYTVVIKNGSSFKKSSKKASKK